jgi:Zn-dependent protease with chaperone function
MRAHRYRTGLAVVAAAAAAGAATLLLRPRGALIDPAVVQPTAYFSPAELERAESFREVQRLIGLAGIAVSGGVMVWLAFRPPGPFRALVAGVQRRPIVGGAAVGAAIVVAVALSTLPLGAVSNARAADVGLSTQDLPAWLGDWGKATALSAGGGAVGGVVALVLMRRFPGRWWIPAAAALVAAAALLTYAAPAVIDPIFSRFDRLPEGALRSSVLTLADRSGVSVGEVYQVDASRRTTGANAYIGGLGPTKRVVLYDNLIEGFPPDEVRSVVAHELAHVEARDVMRALVWLAIVALPATLLIQVLWETITRPGPGERATPAALPALALAGAVVSFALQIPANALSRAVEARADARAIELTSDPGALVELQQRLAVRNLSDPDPPALLHELFGTHPTTLERIGAGVAAGADQGAG